MFWCHWLLDSRENFTKQPSLFYFFLIFSFERGPRNSFKQTYKPFAQGCFETSLAQWIQRRNENWENYHYEVWSIFISGELRITAGLKDWQNKSNVPSILGAPLIMTTPVMLPLTSRSVPPPPAAMIPSVSFFSMTSMNFLTCPSYSVCKTNFLSQSLQHKNL